jgi:hypothetical protein
MRKFWTLALTPLLALAFFLVGAPSANAFGSEVLGCAWNGGGWVASNCGGGSGQVVFSAHNLSGSYSYSWTIVNDLGYSYGPCTGATPCIISGCTATSSTCTLAAEGPLHDRVVTASLTLHQSGLSRTIQAKATIWGTS